MRDNVFNINKKSGKKLIWSMQLIRSIGSKRRHWFQSDLHIIIVIDTIFLLHRSRSLSPAGSHLIRPPNLYFTAYLVHFVHSSHFKNVHFNSTLRYRKLIMYIDKSNGVGHPTPNVRCFFSFRACDIRFKLTSFHLMRYIELRWVRWEDNDSS